jgi:hypothetical protein
MPSPSPQRYGPPSEEELRLSPEAIVPPIFPLSDEGLALMPPLAALKHGLSADALERERSSAAPIVRELLKIPFVDGRNGVPYRRLPLAWVRTLESCTEIMSVPAVNGMVDFLRNASRCRIESYYSPVSGEIEMCEFARGDNDAFLNEYLVLRGRLEDFAAHTRIIFQRGRMVRSAFEFRTGDTFDPSHVEPGDRATITDIYGNELEVRSQTELSSGAVVYVIDDCRGPSANMYDAVRGKSFAFGILAERKAGEAMRSSDLECKLSPPLSKEIAADLLQTLISQKRLLLLTPYSCEKSAVELGKPVYLLPVRVTIEPADAAEKLLWQALRARETAAQALIEERFKFQVTTSDAGVHVGTITYGPTQSAVQRRNGVINVLGLFAKEFGIGYEVRRSDSGEIRVILYHLQNERWKRAILMRVDFAEWVGELETMARERSL